MNIEERIYTAEELMERGVMPPEFAEQVAAAMTEFHLEEKVAEHWIYMVNFDPSIFATLYQTAQENKLDRLF